MRFFYAPFKHFRSAPKLVRFLCSSCDAEVTDVNAQIDLFWGHRTILQEAWWLGNNRHFGRCFGAIRADLFTGVVSHETKIHL